MLVPVYLFFAILRIEPRLQTCRQMHCYETTPPGFCSYYICKLLKIRVCSALVNTLEGSKLCILFHSVLLPWRWREGVRGGGRAEEVGLSAGPHSLLYLSARNPWILAVFSLLFVTGFHAILWWLTMSTQCPPEILRTVRAGILSHL